MITDTRESECYREALKQELRAIPAPATNEDLNGDGVVDELDQVGGVRAGASRCVVEAAVVLCGGGGRGGGRRHGVGGGGGWWRRQGCDGTHTRTPALPEEVASPASYGRRR